MFFMVHLSPLETSREYFLILSFISSLLYSYSILQRRNTPLGANFVFTFENWTALLWLVRLLYHYENMPIQIYWKFYHQKMKIFR